MYLTQSLHRSVQAVPHRTSTVFRDRARTYAQTYDRVARLAAGLRDLGVKPGDRVAICSENSDHYHEYLFAVPWIGAAVNPINARWNLQEIIFLINDSETVVLLTDALTSAQCAEILNRCPSLTHIVRCGDELPPDELLRYEELISGSEPVEDLRVGGESLLGIFYTGGSTGKPKGVMLTHNNLMSVSFGAAASGAFMPAGARLLHIAPMYHMADLSTWGVANILSGTHVFAPIVEFPSVPRLIEQHQISHTMLVPTMIQRFMSLPDVQVRDLSCLRGIVYGGSPIPERILKNVISTLPDVELTQAYGMTELAPVATILRPQDHSKPEVLRSAGTAAPHAEIKIIDPAGVEVPRGRTGEIIVRGPHTMSGYWRRPEETKEALIDGWMHTGDVGYLNDDGFLFIVDRIKDMIVSGGENVYSTEVESVLVDHPAVESAAVVGLPDEQWGERVHAVVVLKPDTRVTDDDLRTFCRTRIAAYKCPKTVEIRQELPVTSTGKINKRELRNVEGLAHSR